MPHPYPEDLAETFIARQALEAAGGGAHVFAIEYAGRLAGVIGIEKRERGAWELQAPLRLGHGRGHEAQLGPRPERVVAGPGRGHAHGPARRSGPAASRA